MPGMRTLTAHIETLLHHHVVTTKLQSVTKESYLTSSQLGTPVPKRFSVNEQGFVQAIYEMKIEYPYLSLFLSFMINFHW